MSVKNFTVKRIVISSTDEFLHVNKSIPDTDNHKTSSHSPICEYHASDEEEEEGGNAVTSSAASL